MTNNPLIITCAITGAELSKQDTPYLPVTPDEIADSACDAVSEGAHIIHLHVRDESFNPTQRVDIFEDVTKKIREKCNCIIQYSTGGSVGTPISERLAPLELKPDMATLSMGTMNFGNDIFENTESTIHAIAKGIKKNRILAELEIFDFGMLDTTNRFLKREILPQNFHINFVLGVQGGSAANIQNLVSLQDRLKKNQTWTVSSMGKFQLPLTVNAITMGGHVRIGFEDNIFYKKGELATSNAQFIKRIVRISNELGRNIATLSEAKNILFNHM